MADANEMSTWPKVPKDEMLSYCTRCMTAVGTKKEHAEALAEVLMAADYRGHYSHGLNRLGEDVSMATIVLTTRDLVNNSQ